LCEAGAAYSRSGSQQPGCGAAEWQTTAKLSLANCVTEFKANISRSANIQAEAM